MRVHTLSDIHGDVLAHEGVLADVERERVDAVAVAADTAFGPLAAKCFELVRAAGKLGVRGDADRLVTEDGADGLPRAAAVGLERLRGA